MDDSRSPFSSGYCAIIFYDLLSFLTIFFFAYIFNFVYVVLLECRLSVRCFLLYCTCITMKFILIPGNYDVTLNQCLRLFTEPEVLTKEHAW